MRFALATLIPVPLLLLSAVFGGLWVAAALVYMTGLVFGLDTLVSVDEPREFPAPDALSATLAICHFQLMITVVWAISQNDLGLTAKIALFLSAGMYFGQVGNANAHELIHKGSRRLHRLGMWVYISLLFGHHTSAHVLVHHRFVASDKDPSSAKLGESYYRFVVRAWVGSFSEGLKAERDRLVKVGRSQIYNPYLIYVGGAFALVAIAASLGGASAVATYVALALYATCQLLLSDYVQHYGLRRKTENGRLEAVGQRHSWNAPHWFSSAMMLNAPRHSDHHAHPGRSFPDLKLEEDSPMLPRSLPTMATLALFPSIWRKVMDPRAKRWANA